ncbi:MAG: peptide chain release factor N(5)-glutamine methyltransferase [Chloroflexota bacterium]|nr:peptide chain release factor N(5)-glutamine methyltransferase [Chloroflexota bacterium]
MLRRRPINLQEMQTHLHEKLQEFKVEQPVSISLVILSHVLKKPKSWVLAHDEYELNQTETHDLQSKLKECLRGVPLPYILGHWEFYGKSFKVTPDVLIPRPETEYLVEKAIEHIHKLEDASVVDVGTGSGVIAISLAAECPSAKILALDLSIEALRVAQENAKRFNQTQIQFIQGDLLTPLNTQFDLIVANLPYIPARILENLNVAMWEPRLALDGGESGLVAIHNLLDQARYRLASPGVILLEIEASLGSACLAAAAAAFPKAQHQLHQDLAGRDRIIEIQQP